MKQPNELYEIVGADGEAITHRFSSRKSLKSAIEINQKFDRDFHLNHKVKVLHVVLEDMEEIPPPPEPELDENQLALSQADGFID